MPADDNASKVCCSHTRPTSPRAQDFAAGKVQAVAPPSGAELRSAAPARYPQVVLLTRDRLEAMRYALVARQGGEAGTPAAAAGGGNGGGGQPGGQAADGGDVAAAVKDESAAAAGGSAQAGGGDEEEDMPDLPDGFDEDA